VKDRLNQSTIKITQNIGICKIHLEAPFPQVRSSPLGGNTLSFTGIVRPTFPAMFSLEERTVKKAGMKNNGSLRMGEAMRGSGSSVCGRQFL
jgi:hypothetical protein